MKKEYKIIGIVILVILLLTIILYSLFYSFQNSGLFTLSNKTTFINNNFTNKGIFTKVSDIFKPRIVSFSLISGYVKDINNNSLANVDVFLKYVNYDSQNNVYRIELLSTRTNENGYFSFNSFEFKNKLLNYNGDVLPPEPYPVFLMFAKDGFMDKYIFDVGEQEKLIYTNLTWFVNIVLNKLPNRNQIEDGNFYVSYYPDQEGCANLAINYLKEYYFKDYNVLGVYPENQITGIIFKTYPEYGLNSWTGSYDGIYGYCHPWTDNITNNQIKQMWENSIPHELVHHFLSFKVNDVLKNTYLLPSWANEGLAYYTQNKVNNIFIDCNNNYLISLDPFISGNMPQYVSASCAFVLLEKNKPGFIKQAISLDKNITFNNPLCTYKLISNLSSSDISGYFIKKILSEAYGSDLTDFFVNKFGFTKTNINLGYNNVIKYLNDCN